MLTRRQFSQLILEMNIAARSPEHWNAVLGKIAVLTDSSKASLHKHEFARHRHMAGARLYSYGYEEAAARDYATKWAPEDEYVRRIRQHHPVGLSSGSCADLMTESELMRTRFYRGYAEPNSIHHVGWITLENDQHFASGMAIIRPREESKFTKEHVRTLQQLAPHMKQAFEMQRHFEHLEHSSSLLQASVDKAHVAVIGLADSGRVTSMSPAAEALLARRDPLLFDSGRIKAANPLQDELLKQALRAAALPLLGSSELRAKRLHFKRSDGKTSLHLEVTPSGATLGSIPAVGSLFAQDDPHIMVLLSDPSSKQAAREEVVYERLRLTGLEAEIALRLLQDCDQKEIAAQLGISDGSVRVHLHNMYERLNVKGQLGFAQLMFNMLLEY